jgi:SAM-dependent methyltransferase
MNHLEHFFCASKFWQRITQRQLLPWLVRESSLGDHILEVGAGYGAATPYLRACAPRVTSLEFDLATAARLKAHSSGAAGTPVCADACALPFADQTFSSVLAILVLHHLRSRAHQERALAEAFRVLRPGGLFLAFEIDNSWLHRVVHFKSTFAPIDSVEAPGQLAAHGFTQVSAAAKSGGFRLRATRPSC